MNQKWHDTLRNIVQMFAATSCVVIVLLFTANTPDADEFTRGIPSGITGALGGWLAGKLFDKRG